MKYFVALIGLLILVDAIGSLLLPGNTHRFWYDLERVFRAIAGGILIAYDLLYLSRGKTKV